MLIYGNLEVEKYKYENILENNFFFLKLSLSLRASIVLVIFPKYFFKFQIQEEKRFYIKNY